MSIRPQHLHHILPRFGLGFARVATEHAIPGSPERCVERTVAADNANSLWMVERLTPTQHLRRETVAHVLAALQQHGLNWVPAYLPTTPHPVEGSPARQTTANTYVMQHMGSHWQVSPFIVGHPLPRPEFLMDAWRGNAVAAMLLALHEAAHHVAVPPAPVPPLADYINHMLGSLATRQPAIYRRLQPAVAVLGDVQALVAAQPQTLAHGDVHPLNLIWRNGPALHNTPVADDSYPAGNAPAKSHGPAPSGKHGGHTKTPPAAPGTLVAAIDWEFCGKQPLLYDVANCVGCCGFEHPSALTGPLVTALTQTLIAGGLSSSLMALLPRMILASRFGWLAEWLRKHDNDMLDMELDYMGILTAFAKTT